MNDKTEDILVALLRTLSKEAEKLTAYRNELMLMPHFDMIEEIQDFEVDILQLQNTICRRIQRRHEDDRIIKGGFLHDNVD